MNNSIGDKEEIDLELALRPETELERFLLHDPVFVAGLRWGVPRYGHPEGAVFKHVREIYQNIERLDIGAADRRKLRLIALVHDTFKYVEDKNFPRDWSRHHSVLARKYIEQYISDPIILDIVELHDEAYHAWRLSYLYQRPEEGEARLQNLLNRIGGNLQLYYLFFKCDTCTGDKTLAPLEWFEAHIPGIEVVEL